MKRFGVHENAALRPFGLLLAALLLVTACSGADETTPQSQDDQAAEDTATQDDQAADDTATDDGETYALRIESAAPREGQGGATYEWWAQEIESRSQGRIEVTTNFGGSPVPATEMLEAVRDGRLDAAGIVPGYFPGDLPLSQVIGIPFETTDPDAHVDALLEMAEENDAFAAEYEDLGLTVIWGVPFGPTVMGFRDGPVTGVEGLAGKQVRAIGQFATALRAVGAEPVGLDPSEMYEAMQRGVVDGYGGWPAEGVPAFGFHEVAPYTADPGVGQYSTVLVAINSEYLQALPDDLQAVIREVSQEVRNRVAIEDHIAIMNEACTQFQEEGAELVVWDESETEHWREMLGDEVRNAWLSDMVDAGIPENIAQEFHAEFLESHELHLEDSPTAGENNPFVVCAEGS